MESYSLLGVKSNNLLFWMKGFPDRQSKALYRFKRRLRHAKAIFYKGYFMTLTIADEHTTSIPVQKWQIANNFYYSESHDCDWDTKTFKWVYSEISDNLTKQVRKFFNNLQTWSKRNLDSKITYVWKIEKGAENGRLHVHCLINFNVDIGRNRYPLWFIKKCMEFWNAGQINWIPMDTNYNKITNYVEKYFTKGGDDTEFNRRRYGTSRDIPGYIPNPNVYYIHSQLVLNFMARLKINNIVLNKDFYKKFIKLWKARFLGYRNMKLDDGRVLYVANVEFYAWKTQTTLQNQMGACINKGVT